ncbi:MAG: EAL domain-containing protein [Sedimenticola sp.]|nr:EAL domain-containing protein [Sedimenticola sp.]
MEEKSANLEYRKDLRRLGLQVFFAVSVWTLLLAGMLVWTLDNVEDEMMELARLEAVANFNKDQAFRAWATSHGGVYVPETERTTASPYLRHIPEHELVTPSGRKLILMNPAFMLRQLMEDYDELYGVKGRITSLNPLNPKNRPDAWETAALKAFAKGEKEVFEITEMDGQPYLRLIRPMATSEGCLKCHNHQGYKVGDVRGGVGVSVPLKKYLSVASERKRNLWSILLVVWIIGLGFIWLGASRNRQRLLERIDYEAHIWNQANFDVLTGLANRTLFLDRLDRAITYAQRDHHLLALLYIDLDRFKDVNDTRGHAIGDELLQEVGRRLQHCVRDMDTVSRLGGDEFTVILPVIREKSSAAVVARSILADLARPFELGGRENYLTASIGITVFPDDGTDSGELLRKADTAMYQAKSAGRDTFRYFNAEMTRQAEHRVSLEADLRQALEKEEFELHYQPVLRLSDAVLVGAEALIRWQSPERGTVPPDDFIPLAEESGLIQPIGRWVIRQAVADLARLDDTGARLSEMAVNISTPQFRDKRFAAQLIEFLGEHPHMQQRLCIEITERVFMDEYSEPVLQLEMLHQEGVRISIDDFGTGYSALGYLKRFPVDTIKIDRSFVRDVTEDREDASLCEAIISIAHHLGMKVVAEGIETREQWEFLQQKGCDFAQGYYMGRPMPLDDFIDFVKARQVA